jgi:glycosyltransferase involved in cell wall biosynthesis
LPKSFKSFLLESLDNCKQIEELQPDFVYCSDHIMCWQAVKFAKKKNIPFLFDVTDDWSKADPSFFGSSFWNHISRKRIIKYAHSITTVSHKQFEYFSKRHKNVYLISNAIPHSFIDKCNAIIPAENKKKIVNFVGSIRDWYDFDLIFSVFEEIGEIELHIYGDGPIFSQIEIKSKEYDMVFVHNSVAYDEIPKLMSESFLGIIPLKNNKLNQSSMPIKLLEYWAASKTVIACPTYEIQKTAGNTVIYANTKEDWINHIKALLENDSKSKNLGKESQQVLLKNHTYKRITEKFIHIFEAK